MIDAERLLATAIKQGDKMADQIAAEMERGNKHWRAVRTAALLLDHGDPDSALRVLRGAINWEYRHGAGRKPATVAADQDQGRSAAPWEAANGGASGVDGGRDPG